MSDQNSFKELPVIKTCPFCGKLPLVGPIDPFGDGNAWAYIRCTNGECPAQPEILDGVRYADNRGVIEYMRKAIEKWNTRHDDSNQSMSPLQTATGT